MWSFDQNIPKHGISSCTNTVLKLITTGILSSEKWLYLRRDQVRNITNMSRELRDLITQARLSNRDLGVVREDLLSELNYGPNCTQIMLTLDSLREILAWNMNILKS